MWLDVNWWSDGVYVQVVHGCSNLRPDHTELKRYIFAEERTADCLIVILFTLIASSPILDYVASPAGRESKKCQTLQPAKTE